MIDTNPITLGVSILGLLGGGLSYILNLKIHHDILTNNAKYDEALAEVKQQFAKDLSAVREDILRELVNIKDRSIERSERLDREVTELKAGLGDRILTTVNGKYTLSAIYNQGMAGLQDRTTNLQRLLEVNLDKLEENLNRQILDLKERIFHKP